MLGIFGSEQGFKSTVLDFGESVEGSFSWGVSGAQPGLEFGFGFDRLKPVGLFGHAVGGSFARSSRF